MGRGTNWAIGLGLVALEVGLVVVGWQWMSQPQAPRGGNISGPQGEKAPKSVWGARVVSAAEASDLHCEGAVFLDVQSKRNNNSSSIPGAEWLDYSKGFSNRQLARHAGPDDKIVVYCESDQCWNAYKLTKDLVKWGMPQVYYFRGGIIAWHDNHSSIKSKFKKKRCGPSGGGAADSGGGSSGGITDKMKYFGQ